ncbi:MAG TPA: hypothetical protein PLD88_00195 [Candidatus Berkiella sp.]|nr:hypothetical protein [Candidatus Berkiella sp.]
MNTISDTIRIANQAIENALTTTGTQKITAANHIRVIEKQKNSSQYSPEDKERKESSEISEAESSDEATIKHIDLRI